MGIPAQRVDHRAPDERQIRQPMGGAHRFDGGIVDFDHDQCVGRGCQRVRQVGRDALANGRQCHDLVVLVTRRNRSNGRRVNNCRRDLLAVGRMTTSERCGSCRDPRAIDSRVVIPPRARTGPGWEGDAPPEFSGIDNSHRQPPIGSTETSLTGGSRQPVRRTLRFAHGSCSLGICRRHRRDHRWWQRYRSRDRARVCGARTARRVVGTSRPTPHRRPSTRWAYRSRDRIS